MKVKEQQTKRSQIDIRFSICLSKQVLFLVINADRRMGSDNIMASRSEKGNWAERNLDLGPETLSGCPGTVQSY